MKVVAVTPEEFLQEQSKTQQDRWAAIDVRSEGEFADGAIPGFVNHPILNNEERHRVGLTYKNQGNEVAVRLGHELISGAVKDARVDAWKSAVSGARRGYVACWRGGSRSAIAADWIRQALGESGPEIVTIQGGYKAVRRVLIQPFQDTPWKSTLRIISGMTGAGKTEFMNSIAAELPARVHWVDLEGHANHRGSSFGLKIAQAQPSQGSFENAVGLDFDRATRTGAKEIWVEDESRSIGASILPGKLKEVMGCTPILFLESSTRERAMRIFGEYVKAELDSGLDPEKVHQHLASRIEPLRKRLGGLMTDEVLKDLNRAFLSSAYAQPSPHFDWIEKLLVHYYDKAYQFAFDRQERSVLFRGNTKECKQWIQEKSR